jgi:hypothetical protein
MGLHGVQLPNDEEKSQNILGNDKSHRFCRSAMQVNTKQHEHQNSKTKMLILSLYECADLILGFSHEGAW